MCKVRHTFLILYASLAGVGLARDISQAAMQNLEMDSDAIDEHSAGEPILESVHGECPENIGSKEGGAQETSEEKKEVLDSTTDQHFTPDKPIQPRREQATETPGTVDSDTRNSKHTLLDNSGAILEEATSETTEQTASGTRMDDFQDSVRHVGTSEQEIEASGSNGSGKRLEGESAAEATANENNINIEAESSAPTESLSNDVPDDYSSSLPGSRPEATDEEDAQSREEEIIIEETRHKDSKELHAREGELLLDTTGDSCILLSPAETPPSTSDLSDEMPGDSVFEPTQHSEANGNGLHQALKDQALPGGSLQDDEVNNKEESHSLNSPADSGGDSYHETDEDIAMRDSVHHGYPHKPIESAEPTFIGNDLDDPYSQPVGDKPAEQDAFEVPHQTEPFDASHTFSPEYDDSEIPEDDDIPDGIEITEEEIDERSSASYRAAETRPPSRADLDPPAVQTGQRHHSRHPDAETASNMESPGSSDTFEQELEARGEAAHSNVGIGDNDSVCSNGDESDDRRRVDCCGKWGVFSSGQRYADHRVLSLLFRTLDSDDIGDKDAYLRDFISRTGHDSIPDIELPSGSFGAEKESDKFDAPKTPTQKSVNDEFVEGLDDIDKFFEGVDPPDELDVGAAGSSMQEVLMGQGTRIIIKRITMALDAARNAIRDAFGEARNILAERKELLLEKRGQMMETKGSILKRKDEIVERIQNFFGRFRDEDGGFNIRFKREDLKGGLSWFKNSAKMAFSTIRESVGVLFEDEENFADDELLDLALKMKNTQDTRREAAEIPGSKGGP